MEKGLKRDKENFAKLQNSQESPLKIHSDNDKKMNYSKSSKEIKRLKKRLEELESEIGEGDVSEKASKKGSKKYVLVLVLLIVILLVVDLLSLFAYYKPDLSGFIKFNNLGNASDGKSANDGRCSDGTADGSCSRTKPLYCYNGELLKNAKICGCSEGY